MNHVGDSLLEICSRAKTELVLVAPFMKEEAVRRLINDVGKNVNVVCVTRWRPEEIKLGVSDLGVWNLLDERPNGKVLLLHNLHAKYYRSDEECLVGSANLTLSALGWSTTPNVELLVPGSLDSLMQWEKDVYRTSVEADQSLVYEMERLVERLPETVPLVTAEPTGDSPAASVQPDSSTYSWLPSLRYPDQLYMAYMGRLEELTLASRDLALSDLSMLNLPRGLAETSFDAIIGAILLQMPLIHKIDQFLVKPRRFGEIRTILRSSEGASYAFNPSEASQTLIRWLRHFVPERYNLAMPNYSEILYRTDDKRTRLSEDYQGPSVT
jgi:hypothetical protein